MENTPREKGGEGEYRDPESNSEQLNNLQVHSTPAKEFASFFFDLLKTGIAIFFITLLLRYFVVQPYLVDGESMMSNYVNNEYLLAEKLTYSFGEPRRGDVVIFKFPENPSINYIKRIIVLPDEKIEIKDNKVTIYNSSNPKGFVLSETYLSSNVTTMTRDENSFSQTMGPNEYFVMGDNREHSSDSREWGILPRANISGRAWFTILPFNRFGTHARYHYLEKQTLKIVPSALAAY